MIYTIGTLMNTRLLSLVLLCAAASAIAGEFQTRRRSYSAPLKVTIYESGEQGVVDAQQTITEEDADEYLECECDPAGAEIKSLWPTKQLRDGMLMEKRWKVEKNSLGMVVRFKKGSPLIVLNTHRMISESNVTLIAVRAKHENWTMEYAVRTTDGMVRIFRGGQKYGLEIPRVEGTHEERIGSDGAGKYFVVTQADGSTIRWNHKILMEQMDK